MGGFGSFMGSLGKGIVKQLPVIGPIVGGMIDRGQSRRDAMRQRDWRREEALTSYQRNQELWNMQNEKSIDFWKMQNVYNSPSEQMKRLKEAGLNPRFIYGSSASSASGTASAPSTSNISPYQAPKSDFKPQTFNTMQMLGMYNDIRQKNAQSGILEEQLKREKWLNREFTEKTFDTNELGNQAINIIKGQTQWKKHWGAQLGKSQADAATSLSESILRGIEADVWKGINDSTGTSSGTMAPLMKLLQLLLMRR